ncbi:MAG: hypothetical protein CL670_01330 [Balneola sp.]|jgi:ABC-type phosphate transport system substrate-binding protein|nr:hypothetical protein [Balneola sp.]MBE77776.1 hypothetical protein [Balneola sp.]HBX66413.1 hypothetical protein [Balneolaceae bacterium]|tara:strand:+ start:534 stop:953 length:420 start_codon:yes stop_codon:yes gene_type:complete
MKNLLFLIIFTVAAATQVNAQTYKVIVNSANSTESISKKDLSDIFLKKQTSWKDGTSATPVDLGTRSTTRAAFTLDVHGQSIGAIRSYWQEASFSGSATPPLERKSDADVVAFVSAYPGAVGYVSDATDVSGVKVLTVK